MTDATYLDGLYPQLGRMAYTEFVRSREHALQWSIEVNMARVERSRAPRCAEQKNKVINHYTCHCGRVRFLALQEYRCTTPTCGLTREESLLRLVADEATARHERKNRGRTIMQIPLPPT